MFRGFSGSFSIDRMKIRPKGRRKKKEERGRRKRKRKRKKTHIHTKTHVYTHNFSRITGWTGFRECYDRENFGRLLFHLFDLLVPVLSVTITNPWVLNWLLLSSRTSIFFLTDMQFPMKERMDGLLWFLLFRK